MKFFDLNSLATRLRGIVSPNADTTPAVTPHITPRTPDAPPKKKTETHRVAGESYYQEAILDLMGESARYTFSKKELIDYGYVDERIYKFDVYTGTADLVPEPENPHDPNAIKVMVEGSTIGYIKQGSCARIHKLLREDGIEKIEVEIKGGDYKIVSEEFDDYTDKVSYTLERDSIAIRAVITLTLK